MPKIDVIRKGFSPAVRAVPLNTTLAILPMTLNQVGKEVEDVNSLPIRVGSIDDAFDKFRPSIRFETQVGDELKAYVADLEFRRLADFSVEGIRKRTAGVRNDIADLSEWIDLLYRLRHWLQIPTVKRVWSDPEQHEQILSALARFRVQLERLTTASRTEAGSTAIEAVGTTSSLVSKVVADIFSDIHPGLSDKEKELDDIFTPETATRVIRVVTDLEGILRSDAPEQALQECQRQIDHAEAVRDAVLAELYEVLRPIEVSYRQVWLFFENSIVPDGRQRRPVTFFILNADAATLKGKEGVTMGALRRFVASHNDNFSFRDDVCNLVVPGDITVEVREALEKEALRWGMLLITDLGDEGSLRDVLVQAQADGRYEFINRQVEKDTATVVVVGFLQLRDAHWFEVDRSDGGTLFAPASLAFAGALARTDRSRVNIVQATPRLMFGQVKGADRARIECRLSEIELLARARQMVTIIRDADNNLCFYGCRSSADDKYGIYKFFTAYRVLSYLERATAARLTDVVGQVLTRETMDEYVEKPLRRMLDEQVSQGTLVSYELFIDKDSNKRMQGICDIYMEVMPVGPAEVVRLQVDVPEFKPMWAAATEYP